MKRSPLFQLANVKFTAARILLGAAILLGLLVEPSLGQAAKMEPNLTELLGQAAAYQAKGQVNQAEKVLKQALSQAQRAGDKRSEAVVKNNLASLWILASKKYRSAGEEADVYLLESLKVAEELKDKKLEASIRVNLGNLLVGWGNYEDAVWNYNEAVKHADGAGDNERAAQCRIGMATAAAFHGSMKLAGEYAGKADKNITALQDGKKKSLLHIKLGDVYSRMMDAAPDREQRGAYLVKGGEQYRKSITEARKAGDEASQAYSLGFLAGLYETEGRYPEALQLSRAALDLAQAPSHTQGRGPRLSRVCQHLLARWIVDVDDGDRSRGEMVAEEPRLRGEVGVHAAVEVEVILGEVRERGHAEGAALHTTELESV